MLFKCINRFQAFLEGINRESRFVSFSIEMGFSDYSPKCFSCVHSTYSKTSSKDAPNILAILNASVSEGAYFPCSRATIV